MQTTRSPLEQAFTEASERHHRCLAFAAAALAEGDRERARLFRAAAASHAVHARNYAQGLEVAGTTRENLSAAVDDAERAVTDARPRQLAEVAARGDENARILLRWGLEAERRLLELYRETRDRPLGSAPSLRLCQICGYLGPAEERGSCPVCGAPPSKFDPIE